MYVVVNINIQDLHQLYRICFCVVKKRYRLSLYPYFHAVQMVSINAYFYGALPGSEAIFSP